MMFSVPMQIDWTKLERQKDFLLSLMDTYGDGLLGGIVELIDHIQECGEREGEPVVWTTMEGTDGEDRRMDG